MESKITWKPGWYGDRLHATRGTTLRMALCGFVTPHVYSKGTWFKNKVERGIPKCKKCLKILAAEEHFKEINNGR